MWEASFEVVGEEDTQKGVFFLDMFKDGLVELM